MNTSPRVAIVTGGSGGIGGAVAKRLGADGFAVVVHYGGNAEPAKEIVVAIRAAGGTASAFGADVADESEVAALFQHATAEFGGVDVVVNAGGIMPLAPVAQTDLDTAMLDENTRRSRGCSRCTYKPPYPPSIMDGTSTRAPAPAIDTRRGPERGSRCPTWS